MATWALEEPTTRSAVKREARLRALESGGLLTTDFPPILGGISSYLFNVYRHFDLHRMTLIAPQHPDAVGFDSEQTYSARRFQVAPNIPGIRGAWQVWRMYAAAEKLVKQNQHFLLHCGHVNAAIAARKLKRRYGTPYLLWAHALEVMDERLRSIILPAMSDADLVITNSEFTRKFVASVGVLESRIAAPRAGRQTEFADSCPHGESESV